MIAHVIMFRPKTGLTADDRTAIVDALTAAASGIPAIRRFRIGRRVRHGLPGYEQLMREDYEYAVMIEVEDLDALKSYLQHPSHATLGRHFTQSATAALAYDYEIVGASQAGRLIGD